MNLKLTFNIFLSFFCDNCRYGKAALVLLLAGCASNPPKHEIYGKWVGTGTLTEEYIISEGIPAAVMKNIEATKDMYSEAGDGPEMNYVEIFITPGNCHYIVRYQSFNFSTAVSTCIFLAKENKIVVLNHIDYVDPNEEVLYDSGLVIRSLQGDTLELDSELMTHNKEDDGNYKYRSIEKYVLNRVVED